MTKKKKLSIFLPVKSEEMSYKADKLRKLLDGSNTPIVVDVRSKHEFQQAHIPGAIHLPFWLIPFRFKSLQDHRDKIVVLYCEHGPRAVLALKSLQSKGFNNAECLDGHMQGWRKAGFPLIN